MKNLKKIIKFYITTQIKQFFVKKHLNKKFNFFHFRCRHLILFPN